MSDSYSGSESEDNRSNHDQFSDDREESDNREEESDSVSEQSDDDGDAESGGAVETSSIVGNNNLRLCPSHAAGSMTPDCKFCKAALGVISDNNLKKQLTQNSAQSGLVSRYAGRCDIQPATLTLGASSLEIGQAIFSKGVFRDRKAWQDIVKKFLTLPQLQHDLLTADIKTEDIINKYKNEKRFQYIFRFHKDIVDILRNLRVSQRPLLSLIEKNHDAILSVRKLGEEAGVTFPENAPEKVGGTVPRDGHSLTDQLHVSSSDGLFPLPDMESLIDSAGLTEFQARKVADFMEGFGSCVGEKYMELFKAAATHINVAEDQLVFYTDLYSHVDASLREVIREKMSSLFRSHIKSDVLSQTTSKQLSEKPSGFFGGNKKIRDVIGASTKKNSVLEKAVLPKKNYKKESNSSPRRNRSRSRSRSRNRSPTPRSARSRGSSSGYYRKRKASGGGKGSKNGKNGGGDDDNGGHKDKRAKGGSKKKE